MEVWKMLPLLSDRKEAPADCSARASVFLLLVTKRERAS